MCRISRAKCYVEVDRLAAAADTVWDDDQWVIDLKLWTNGTTNAYAYKRAGHIEAGHQIEKRLFVVDGEVWASKHIYSNEQLDEWGLGLVDS
ncbi:hypothetical protein [Halohasta litorea]|uniref:SnoaL-like domain-containing protein n=1 Tax=Halohasta litorea TaxID=869891 RepID=A0ABD6DC64_9EURY|nr:hypothetical protein [Halohasta litorea]